MNIVHYAAIGAVAFVVVLTILVINIIKLKSARADAAEKAAKLERYATITNAETEAERIVNAAKQTAEELIIDSQNNLDEAKAVATKTIAASEKDAKSITQRAEDILSDARLAAKRMNAEALTAVETQRVKRTEIEKQIDELRKSYREKKITYNELEEAISIYKDDMEFADMGFYAPHFDFETSASFQDAIKACRERQKKSAT